MKNFEDTRTEPFLIFVIMGIFTIIFCFLLCGCSVVEWRCVDGRLYYSHCSMKPENPSNRIWVELGTRCSEDPVIEKK